MKKKIKAAYKYVVNKCNDPHVGYSQANRGGQIVNGVQYFDCSSLIWFALRSAGFTTDQIGANCFTTYTMKPLLLKCGFTCLDAKTTKWKKGDILLRSEHTEMVYKGKYTMGAHTSNRILKDQVSINTIKSNPQAWDYILRF